jgi:hypothetical protein
MGSGPFALHFVHGVVFGENSLPHSKRPDNAPRRPLFWHIIPDGMSIPSSAFPGPIGAGLC